jgi:signal peptidase I
VIAFVLAFLFRTFEAEAFVIPTGSMAPTLMGRHKDVVCPKCGYAYRVSASSEVDQEGNPRGEEVISGTCPMCRYTADLGPNNSQGKRYPSYTGDRIIVEKYPYQFRDPKRWEVAVFRYPGEAHVNFIKRVVGLPRETVQIYHGDLWVKRDGEPSPVIQRKPPQVIRAVLQPVYDNDYVLPQLIERGWPPRWASDPGRADGGVWTSQDYRSFQVEGSGDQAAWLRYRHFVPTAEQWQKLESGPLSPLEQEGLRPQLITDFTAYNTFLAQRDGGYWHPPGPLGPSLEGIGFNWVGDLAVECLLESKGSTGQALLELVKGGARFRATFDLADGSATLSIEGLDKFRPKARTGVRGAGKHWVMLANVDRQLVLWVDGQVVPFDAPTTYPDKLSDDIPRGEDLAPVGVGSRGAALRVSHLRVSRDLYYIATSDPQGRIIDFDRLPFNPGRQEDVAEFFSSPEKWQALTERRSVDFHLGAGQFMMLGDNSAESKDSRLWGSEFYVRRELLIGRAFFIYWPHSWDATPALPLLGWHIPFPFFPNFARMGFVR